MKCVEMKTKNNIISVKEPGWQFLYNLWTEYFKLKKYAIVNFSAISF